MHAPRRRLAPHEVEIQAGPLPGTAVGHDGGVVIVLDPILDDELRAEGDAREVARAVAELRKQAGLELGDAIELWLTLERAGADGLRPYLVDVAAEALVTELHVREAPPPDDPTVHRSAVRLSGGRADLALRRTASALA